MRVSDAMTTSPVAIPEDTPVRAALALLETMEVRHLPVTDAKGVLVGLVSERDLHSFYAPRAELAGDWAEQAREKLGQRISQIMITRPIVVEDDAPITRAIDTLIAEKVSAVPVVHNGKLVGIVSYVDLLRVLARLVG